MVNQNIGQAILTFRGAANGEEAPIRTIQGPRTLLRDPQSLAIDPAHDEIFVADMSRADRVFVFDRKAQGDIAPKRILQGPDTMLGAQQLAVDPVHDLLIVGGNAGNKGDLDGSAERGMGTRIMLFDRTASGNAKPKRMIGGAKSGLTGIAGHGFRVVPESGMIIVNVAARANELAVGESYAAVWSINDEGDVAPRYTFGKGSLMQARGLTFDAKNKNVIVADKFLQGVLTFSLPEVFRTPATSTSSSGR